MTDSDLNIEAVLDYYSDEVIDALATAVVIADQFPEKPLMNLGPLIRIWPERISTLTTE